MTGVVIMDECSSPVFTPCVIDQLIALLDEDIMS
jgi:hypothetical protein